jgi:hypothetical protein
VPPIKLCPRKTPNTRNRADPRATENCGPPQSPNLKPGRQNLGGKAHE